MVKLQRHLRRQKKAQDRMNEWKDRAAAVKAEAAAKMAAAQK